MLRKRILVSGIEQVGVALLKNHKCNEGLPVVRLGHVTSTVDAVS